MTGVGEEGGRRREGLCSAGGRRIRGVSGAGGRVSSFLRMGVGDKIITQFIGEKKMFKNFLQDSLKPLYCKLFFFALQFCNTD